jgi:uncharacterized membrane protein
MALFVSSMVILGIKLLQPASVNITVAGSQTSVVPLPGLFTLTDVEIVAISSIIVGASSTYLLLSDSRQLVGGQKVNLPTEILEQRRVEWLQVAKTLKDDEQRIYQEVLGSDGIILQSELVGKVGLSKSTVSRNLELLESKGLLERKRRGMSNLILLR